MKTTYGKRLKKLRTAAKLSQSELALKANVKIDTIQNHEQDRSSITADMLFTYCKALGVDCSSFAGCLKKTK